MSTPPATGDDPDRLYTVTSGRSRQRDRGLDLVTLIVTETDAPGGPQSEHARILRLCRAPTAVVEVSAHLAMPVSVVKILLADLLAAGRVAARHPRTSRGIDQLPDSDLLKQVLVGLHKL